MQRIKFPITVFWPHAFYCDLKGILPRFNVEGDTSQRIFIAVMCCGLPGFYLIFIICNPREEQLLLNKAGGAPK